jgi:hypothetical protein
MTHHYVDKAVQTTISGLTKHPAQNPPALSGLATTTPPEDMPAKDIQDRNIANAVPSLLVRRKQRASLVRRITLPDSNFDEEGSHSPPPTEAVLSPLPAANTLHAGHTPIIPRSLSPLRMQEHSRESSPGLDEPLTGPLTLPAQPGDGAGDRIELKVLDAELEKIAKAQNAHDPPSPHTENEPQQCRKGSTDARRRSSADDVEVFDGVILKKPRMNMGAPLGQA